MPTPPGDDRVVLIGLMGAGKTSVGRALAERRGVARVDVDAEVERREGRPVSAIFESDGEAAFRALEAAVAAEALADPTVGVVALGGGAVLDPATRAAARSAGRVVWLRAEPEVLARRVGAGAGRPLLDGTDVLERLRALAADRRSAYEAAATEIVDVDGLDVDDVVERIEAGRP